MTGGFRILISSDNHTGYAEDKSIIGNDSFDGFEEVLQHAANENVDFILLGGDLFHKSEPDRSTIHKVTELLRTYVLGDRPISFEFLSEPGDVFPFSKFQRVNFEDNNINIAMPIFTIHGNHDDFSGKGLLALDNFHDSGFLNLFGKFTNVEKIEVKPVLLKKGDTKLALYGIGHQEDDRLCRAFMLDKIKFFCPEDEFDDWFKILVVHQNRPPRSTTRTTGSYLPYDKIPKFFDLVVWGHEHACYVEDMEYSRTGEPYVLQPGSSVATSLCPDETKPKAVALLTVDGTSAKIERIPLERSRQIIYKVLDLGKDYPTAKLPKTKVRTKTGMKDEEIIRKEIEKLLQEAEETRGDHQPDLPRIRIKVIYSKNWADIPPVKPAVIGVQYKKRVANHEEMIKLKPAVIGVQYKKRVANHEEMIKCHIVRPEHEKPLYENVDLRNMTDTTTVFDLLRDAVKQRAKNGLNLLQIEDMEKLVKEQGQSSKVAAKDKKEALKLVVDDQIQNYMSRIRKLDMSSFEGRPSDIKSFIEPAIKAMVKANREKFTGSTVVDDADGKDENAEVDEEVPKKRRGRKAQMGNVPVSVIPESPEIIDVDDDDEEFPGFVSD
uniref:Double-strand break repair protein n=2 Tax=Panagrolaimus sp. JU765 TaxID=591449 RepID=A0AC34RH62_9BILA